MKEDNEEEKKKKKKKKRRRKKKRRKKKKWEKSRRKEKREVILILWSGSPLRKIGVGLVLNQLNARTPQGRSSSFSLLLYIPLIIYGILKLSFIELILSKPLLRHSVTIPSKIVKFYRCPIYIYIDHYYVVKL